MFCDLQTHSTASDGTDPPEALGPLALAAGLAAVALTDHDTTEGLPAFLAGCAAAGIIGVPGIELSVDPGPGIPGVPVAALLPAPTEIRPPESADVPEPPASATLADALGGARRGTLHLLGLFVRHDDPGLNRIHATMLGARAQRNPRIIENLRGLGLDIAYDEVLALAGSQGTRVVGRPHIAQTLVNKGHAASVADAFARYLGEGKPAYARKDLLPAAEAIDAIHAAGGLAILAHPAQLRHPDLDALTGFVRSLQAAGLDGVETRHSDHSPEMTDAYEQIARELGLLISGGSDYHGDRKAIPLGGQRVPMAVYERLHAAWVKRGA